MNTEELRKIIASGENEQVEFKARIPKQDVIGRHLASFANTAGGTIFFGIQESAHIAGVDPIRTKAIVEASLRALSPQITHRLEQIEIDDKIVVAVVVDKSPELVSANGSYYARSGATTRPMKSEEIELSMRSDARSVMKLADSIEQQTEIIEILRKELKSANSFWPKLGWTIGGALAGGLISLMLG
ncbi:hypothetical protein DDZ13_08920 [Coraliomargarita sinensis]|uniref:Schlafen AlbA-2 domain-containing protein n=1 Tax=Coraliomargarita sinensis TaxID=2174842 RepID=A0A317ZLA3_9BACT|nr:ATP-binding protein [Coraliomargarita sinensis]PXA04151.1 hypothetical protein DDZ13_08920 [Coraliomargarita sinensis]